MKKSYTKYGKVSQCGLFKTRNIIQKFEWSDKIWNDTQYQCPCCGEWFTAYGKGIGAGGVKVHISRIAKHEAVGKQLGETKKSPHFDFWKKNTFPMNQIYKQREWKFHL